MTIFILLPPYYYPYSSRHYYYHHRPGPLQPHENRCRLLGQGEITTHDSSGGRYFLILIIIVKSTAAQLRPTLALQDK